MYGNGIPCRLRLSSRRKTLDIFSSRKHTENKKKIAPHGGLKRALLGKKMTFAIQLSSSVTSNKKSYRRNYLHTNKHFIKRTLWISSILLTALVTGCNSSSNSESTVIANYPADGEKAAPLNHKVVATFSEAMDGTTVDRQSFSVKAAGEQALSGIISVDAASHTASFTPAGNGFTASTAYTATLTTAIKSKAGSVPLTDNYVWQFTSGAATDDDAPSVTSTNPVDADNDAILNRSVSANFSEVLDPATVNAANVTLIETVSDTAVSGDVSFGGTVVTFTPNRNLAKNTEYTAKLTTGIIDLAVNPLAADFEWSFTTGTTIAEGPKPVNLGTGGDFAILTKTGITNIFESAITGNIGASGITAASMDTVTCPEITGNIYGDDAGIKTDCYIKSGKAASAVLDMGIAYRDAAGRTTPDYTELYAGDLSSKTLVPGLYKWGTNVLINKDVYLDGGANDVWIFQIAGDVIQASSTHVYLQNGALAKNVFWQVGGGAGVALGTDADFKGIVLAEKGITVNTNAVVNGRLLSQTAVTLDQNTVTQPAE